MIQVDLPNEATITEKVARVVALVMDECRVQVLEIAGHMEFLVELCSVYFTIFLCQRSLEGDVSMPRITTNELKSAARPFGTLRN